VPRSPKSRASGSGPAGKAPRPPVREELIARGLMMQAPWRGHAMSRDVEVPTIVPTPAQSPVQSTVNRSVPLDVFSIDTEIKSNGRVIVVLRRPYGFPSGPMPGDPAGFSARVRTRLSAYP
jgi:hypothetical protein